MFAYDAAAYFFNSITDYFYRDIKIDATMQKEEDEADKLASAHKIKEAIEKYFIIIKKRGFQQSQRLERKLYKLFSISEVQFKLNHAAINALRRRLVLGHLKKDEINLQELGISSFSKPDVVDVNKLRLQLTMGKFHEQYLETDPLVVNKQLADTAKGFALTLTPQHALIDISLSRSKHPIESLEYGKQLGVAYCEGPKNLYKKQIEDCFKLGRFTSQFKDGAKEVIFGGVFDGHGGKKCAEFISQNLELTLKNVFRDVASDNNVEVRNGLITVCLELDKNWHKKYPRDESGSTASIFMQIKASNCVWCANLGDSRIVFNKNGTPIQLSEDADLSHAHFVEESRDHGGIFPVTHNENDPRLWGILVMLSSFGDYKIQAGKTSFKLPGLTAIPQVVKYEFDPKDPNQYLILATDGVWGNLNTTNVVNIVQKRALEQAEVQSIAYSIVFNANNNLCTDDCTVVVVQLN